MICKECKARFDETQYAWWDESCFSGSVKYCACPGCNKVTMLKFVYDYDFRKKSVKHDSYLDKYIDLYEQNLMEEKE